MLCCSGGLDMVGRISYSFLSPLISDEVQTERHFFFKFFIAQEIKNNVFSDVTPCSLVEVYRRFEGPSVMFYFEEKVQQGNKEEANRIYEQFVCLLVLLFDSEEGGSAFLRNVGNFLPDYTASRPRRYYLSQSLPPESHTIQETVMLV
jgi:hypothetical protein